MADSNSTLSTRFWRKVTKSQADGWIVFHISGSELWRAPHACVDEVYALCRKRAQEAINESVKASVLQQAT